MDKHTARATLDELLAEKQELLARIEELAPVIKWFEGKVGAGVERAKLPTGERSLFEVGLPEGRAPASSNGAGHGPLAGMPMKKALGFVIAAMEGDRSTVQLQADLLANGFTSKAKALHNTVYGTLNRFREEGQVQRIGPGLWRRAAQSTLPTLGVPIQF